MRALILVLVICLAACDTTIFEMSIQTINNNNKIGICTLMVDSSKYTLDQLNDINVKLTISEPASLDEADRKQIFINEVNRRTTKDWNNASKSCKSLCESLAGNKNITQFDQESCDTAFNLAVSNCFISGFCYKGDHIRK